MVHRIVEWAEGALMTMFNPPAGLDLADADALYEEPELRSLMRQSEDIVYHADVSFDGDLFSPDGVRQVFKVGYAFSNGIHFSFTLFYHAGVPLGIVAVADTLQQDSLYILLQGVQPLLQLFDLILRQIRFRNPAVYQGLECIPVGLIHFLGFDELVSDEPVQRFLADNMEEQCFLP